MKQSVRVEIFGREYILKSESGEGHVQKVADLVDGKMKEISLASNSKNVLNIAVLAALNIADDYVKLLDEKEAAKGKAIEIEKLLDDHL